jgi:hypothetical protein
MKLRLKRILLLILAAALLLGAGRMQQALNLDRDKLGLTRSAVLENAPPALAFTTVALGGFRGLISNFLWMRANDLQQDDKCFEAAQLADWITKLEPTFTQVWCFQAWNMAYNISVKMKENSPGVYADRWNWVQRGIELLRDDGLRYNPNSILIYRELGWFFQHKMGQNMDDGNLYYKLQWMSAMTNFFGRDGTNFGPLLHPQTPADYHRLEVLTNQYKIDPVFAERMDKEYGPFDWRLPEAHAVYWGGKALDEGAKHPDKVNTSDLITVRRIIYQSLLQSLHNGRVIADPFSGAYALGPNLDLIPNINRWYTNFYAQEPDPGQKDGILRAHRNFLRDAIYFLYEADRTGEAQQWFDYLAQKYPDKPIVETDPHSLPRTLTLDEYAVAVVRIDLGETSQQRVTAGLLGLLNRAYRNLANGDDDRYENLMNLASKVHKSYDSQTSRFTGDVRIKLLPFEKMKASVVKFLLTPENGLPYAARAVLVTRLGLPTSWLESPNPETPAPPQAGESVSTNSTPTNAAPPSAP